MHGNNLTTSTGYFVMLLTESGNFNWAQTLCVCGKRSVHNAGIMWPSWKKAKWIITCVKRFREKKKSLKHSVAISITFTKQSKSGNLPETMTSVRSNNLGHNDILKNLPRIYLTSGYWNFSYFLFVVFCPTLKSKDPVVKFTSNPVLMLRGANNGCNITTKNNNAYFKTFVITCFLKFQIPSISRQLIITIE